MSPPLNQPASTTVAVFAGTFDPLTLGHLDLIQRACVLFDRLVVAVAENPKKTPLFPPAERVAILRAATSRWSNVEVVSLEGLTVEYARRVGAQFIVRGLRAVSDFEFEGFYLGVAAHEFVDDGGDGVEV